MRILDPELPTGIPACPPEQAAGDGPHRRKRVALRTHGNEADDTCRGDSSNRSYVHEALKQSDNRNEPLSFPDYMNRCRIAYCIELLQKSDDMKIETPAYESGFVSKATFYKNYKRFTGLPPPPFWRSANDRETDQQTEKRQHTNTRLTFSQLRVLRLINNMIQTIRGRSRLKNSSERNSESLFFLTSIVVYSQNNTLFAHTLHFSTPHTPFPAQSPISTSFTIFHNPPHKMTPNKHTFAQNM